MKHHLFICFATLSCLQCLVSCSRKEDDTTPPAAEESKTAQARPSASAPEPSRVATPEKSMPGREPLLENPNFKPAPAPGSQRMDVVAQRIQQQFQGLASNTPAAQSKFNSLWKSASTAAFARPLVSSSDPNVAQGKIMPSEVSSALLGDDELMVAIENGKLPFGDSTAEFLDGVLTKLILALGSTTSGIAALPDVLKERMNALPPTAEDLAALLAVKQALRELRSSGAAASNLDEWRSLATAKNPIYRYLALLAAPHTRTNGVPASDDQSSRDPRSSEALLSFYQPYLSESDDLLLERAIKSVGNLGTATSKRTLELLATQQRVKQSEQLAEVVQIAIQDCDAMLRLAAGK